MVRYVGKYVCKDCGHQFIGMDIERNATAASYPVKCPNCGSIHTTPGYSFRGMLTDPCYILDIIKEWITG